MGRAGGNDGSGSSYKPMKIHQSRLCLSSLSNPFHLLFRFVFLVISLQFAQGDLDAHFGGKLIGKADREMG